MRQGIEAAEDDLGDDDDRDAVIHKASKSGAPVASLSDDETIDVVTGSVVKLRGNEKVRQQVARFLSVEYGIPVDAMARDFPIPVDTGGARRSVKKADLAVFSSGEPHTLANLQRVRRNCWTTRSDWRSTPASPCSARISTRSWCGRPT
jgi:type I restriction enzyme M protein